ncbi:MAG: hypothetical protein AB2598_01685 [Candidatus Thiodiazotropha sp.]
MSTTAGYWSRLPSVLSAWRLPASRWQARAPGSGRRSLEEATGYSRSCGGCFTSQEGPEGYNGNSAITARQIN